VPIDAVVEFRRNFLAACHCHDDDVPIPTSSIICPSDSHQQDYPSPAVTRYIDEALEAGRLVPREKVWTAIGELMRDPAWFRHFQAARMLDLMREPLKAKAAAARLRVQSRRVLQMRREFWQELHRRVTGGAPAVSPIRDLQRVPARLLPAHRG
jgi:hypothetical protein